MTLFKSPSVCRERLAIALQESLPAAWKLGDYALQRVWEVGWLLIWVKSKLWKYNLMVSFWQ